MTPSALNWTDLEKRISFATDPYDRVSLMFKKNDYDALAAVLRREKGTTAREISVIPAALLLGHIDSYAFWNAMTQRNAEEPAAYCIGIANKLAELHKLSKIKGPDSVGTNPLPRTPFESYDRIFKTYSL